jgi:hypothetical protein
MNAHRSSAVWLTAVAVCTLLLLPSARAEGPTVVSARGSGHVGKAPLAVGLELGKKGTLHIERESMVQLLLGPSLLCGVGGESRVRFDGSALWVESAEGPIRLSGQGGSIRQGPWKAHMDQGAASVILTGKRLYVLTGQVRVVGPAQASDAPGDPVERLPPTNMTVEAGYVMRFDVQVPAMPERGAAPKTKLAQTLRFESPGRWDPKINALSPADEERAVEWTTEQLRTQKEMASCGCTESSGSSAGPQTGQGPTSLGLEGRGAVLRVKVIGLPKAGGR